VSIYENLFDYSRIRPDIREALDNWGSGDAPYCGDFLRAVLSNDLREAVGRADNDNLRTLPAIVGYVYNELPGNCHGSPEIVAEWAERHRDRLLKATESAEPTGKTIDLMAALKESLRQDGAL
jgi:hypothetical protein